MDGLILLDKPIGLSSARAVARVRRLLPKGTKVGHAGTLDPFATGLLVLLIGKYTRRCEEIMSMPKCYETIVKLGATTATDDPESAEIMRTIALAAPTAMELQHTIGQFVGAISQRPPVYSAIKVAGKRACDRTRNGEVIELQTRIVHVRRIDVLNYEWPLAKLRIECGRGTYIRSIARDLGEKLGVGGYLTELRRMSIGGLRIDDAVKLDELNQENVASKIRGLGIS